MLLLSSAAAAAGIFQNILFQNNLPEQWENVKPFWERSGSVVECLTRDRGATGSSLTDVTALCPCERHINPNLVLVQPRKTRPFITERLLMGHKISNQTQSNQTFLDT